MLNVYPFILPITIVWLITFVLIIIVYHTGFGLRQRPILNKRFVLRFVNLSVFILGFMIFFSGIMQLFGVFGIYFGKSTGYWHALIGTLFTASALNHLAIHIKVIWRYFFKKKQPDI